MPPHAMPITERTIVLVLTGSRDTKPIAREISNIICEETAGQRTE